MCNCFRKLADEAKRVAKEEYPNREILSVVIGQGYNPKNNTQGHVNVSVTFKSPKLNNRGEYGIFRRHNIGFKNYSKTKKRALDVEWKCCPMCGELL